MKRLMVFWAVGVTLLVFGCRQDSPSTVTTRLVGSAVTVQVPEPKLVPYSNIPFPIPNAVYRIAGAEFGEGPEVVLQSVLDAGFRLQRAWHPQIYLCMALFLDELIIELEEPDDAIFALGFTRDFDGTAGRCASQWNEYSFVDDDRDTSQTPRRFRPGGARGNK